MDFKFDFSNYILYNQTKETSNNATFVDAREVAPIASSRDMFNSTKSDAEFSNSALGLLSIATPGELAGYWHMFNKYGSKKITWKRLFHDAINFAKNGFPVGRHLEEAISQKRDFIMAYNNLKNVYYNQKTDDFYKHGEILKQPKLAETLTNLSLAKDAKKYFYEELSTKIIEDLQNNTDFPNQKPILTVTDFHGYIVDEKPAYSFNIKDDIKLLTARLPGLLNN